METGPVVQVAKRRCNLPFAGGGPASRVGEAAREWGPFAFPGPASKGGLSCFIGNISPLTDVPGTHLGVILALDGAIGGRRRTMGGGV